MLEIGNNAGALTEYKDIAFKPISNQQDIKHVQHRTLSGQRYNRSTGRAMIDYEVSFDNIEKTEYEDILQYCSPQSIKNYYVRYTNSENTVIFQGFGRIVIDNVRINHDSQLYTFSINIELE